MIPWNAKTDIATDGILWKNNDSDIKIPVHCIVNGVCTKKSFHGNISISSQEDTILDVETDILFDTDWGLIIDFDGNTYGMFFIAEDKEQFVILLYDDMLAAHKDWSASNSLVISAPAGNRAEAMQLARDMGKGNEFLQSITWN